MPTTYDTLVEKCGVLMTFDHLAQIMHRSPDAIRVSLSPKVPKSEWARQVKKAKRTIGRRVLFRTADIARIVDEGLSDDSR